MVFFASQIDHYNIFGGCYLVLFSSPIGDLKIFWGSYLELFASQIGHYNLFGTPTSNRSQAAEGGQTGGLSQPSRSQQSQFFSQRPPTPRISFLRPALQPQDAKRKRLTQSTPNSDEATIAWTPFPVLAARTFPSIDDEPKKLERSDQHHQIGHQISLLLLRSRF